MAKKVFVIDYDLISPLGIGKEAVFKNIEKNFSAAKTLTRFSTEGLPLDFAAEITTPLNNFYKNENDTINEIAAYDRKFELAIASYFLMEERLNNLSEFINPARAGIVFGLGVDVPPITTFEKSLNSDFEISEDSIIDFLKKINKTKGFMNQFLNPLDISALFIANKMKLGAFQKTVLTACTASTQSIAIGYDSIVNDEADITITGGSDSIINPLAFMAFTKLGVLSTNTINPLKACRPFDITRNGTLAGEASGICILASEDFVIKNKLIPKFEILGYGNTLDAYNITSPDPKGIGMRRAFQMALKNSKIKPSDVDYINLHGTGTRSNDEVEINAVRMAFGDCAANIPMSSTKDRHGHAIASAGIQEFSILGLCMENDLIPCNVNLEKPIGHGEVDLVKGNNRTKKINIGLTANFAFGGVNTVIAVKKI